MRPPFSVFAGIVAGCCLIAATQPGQTTGRAKEALSTASGLALQGKGPESAKLLASIPAEEFAEKDRAIRDCMIERLGPGPTSARPTRGGTYSDRAVAAYQTYWRSALRRPDRIEAAEEELIGRLRGLLQLPASAGWSEVESALRGRIAAEGNHVLMGRTPPLLELMIWKTEVDDLRDVALPEGTHRISVKTLDNFGSLGWSAFATCNRSFTGGWVQSDGIYAVRPGWKNLTDENFAVSFVAHETQHFADKARFGEIESWELEYRAKLAELALAKDTLPRLLTAFQRNRGQDPNVPHSYANALVLARLQAKLGRSATDLAAAGQLEINAAAHALLAEDSERRAAGQK